MRSEGLRAPVVIFSTRTHADDRKRLALSLGARSYCYQWETLVQEIEAVLATGTRTG